MQFRHLTFAAVSLTALAVADPARADCISSNAASVTTLTCGTTVTTNATNNNENNAGTTARAYRFPSTTNVTISSGATVSGLGLLIWPTGANPLTVTNNGTVSHTAGETLNGQPVNGLEIIGNGGLVTYLGNGSATTNATPPSLASGLSISNTNGGGINIGSAIAPITGATFSGEAAVTVRAPSGGFINAWFNGGTFTATTTAADALELTGLGNVLLNMTGEATLNGSLRAGVYSNAPDASTVSVTTNAHITETLGPAVSIGGVSGGTSFNLTSGGSITGQATGVSMFAEGGQMSLTTAAGTTINATSPAGLGVQLQPDAGSGSIVADISGSISGTAGIYLVPANGTANITIQPGGSVSGTEVGLTVVRFPGHTGVVDILNLGTISSPITAADFDGTLRIGNGGTTGTISGDIINGGSLIFNRSNASSYAGVVSGAGTLTKQGAGTLTLTGASTYTGATTVSGGTLLVNGSLTSATTVAVSATLGGTGSVGNLTVNGSLAPGGNGTIGTLTIDGNLVLGAGSTFRVDIGNGTADRVNVTGTATLAGSLIASSTAQTFTAGTSTLLNAAGGISGTFNPLTTNPNANATLSYDANNVFLEVTQGSFVLSTSQTESLVFTAPAVTTNHATLYSTQILGRLMGGQPLYDQTFAAAFGDPLVQNGLLAARAAITTAGGPGVIISDPVRTASATTTNTTSVSTFTLAGTQVTQEEGVLTFGPASVTVGQISTCNVSSLPSSTRPTCQTGGGTPLTLTEVDSNINVNTATVYTIAETRTDTVTETVSETWELNGTVVSVGTVHAAVQSGLFDQGGRLLRRLGEQGAGGWAEVYMMNVDHGDERDTRGIAGGFGIAAGEGLTLGLAVDQGWIDIDIPGAIETGELKLTELGASARIDSGGFSAALSGVYGFGSADTLRTIIGASGASYDVKLAGAALDLGYLIETGGWQLRPVAGLDHVSIETDGFAESDTLGLVAPEHDADRTRASAGLEIGRDFGGVELMASARYVAVLDGEERALPVAFALAPGTPLVMTGPAEGDSALVAARARIPLAPGASIVVGYDGRFGGGYESHGGFAGVSVAF